MTLASRQSEMTLCSCGNIFVGFDQVRPNTLLGDPSLRLKNGSAQDDSFRGDQSSSLGSIISADSLLCKKSLKSIDFLL